MSLLQMSFCGAVMILVIAAIRAAAIGKLPKRTFLVLWGIVLFRLLVPIEIPSALSVYSFIEYDFLTGFADNLVAENNRPDAAKDSIEMRGAENKQNDLLSEEERLNSAASITVVDDGEKKTSGVLADEGGAETSTEISDGGAGMSFSAIADKAALLLSGMTDRIKKNVRLFVWGIGALICAVFFIVAYVKCRREFSMSLPACNEFVIRWIEKRRLSKSGLLLRRLSRRMDIRLSDRIDTPLTYGFYRPVILLPKKMEWENTRQLEFILWHEYMHICHGDALVKLLAVIALCIHWFNPFVWMMYFLLNRDIELACDESVVQKCGVRDKSAYAGMLICMEEKRSNVRPLCNNFSQNAIEKRIRAIMKIRKFSVGACVFAVSLVTSVSLVFATSAVDVPEEISAPSKTDFTKEISMPSKMNFTGEISIPSNTDFTEEEYKKLWALCLKGYEDMNVFEYRSKILAMTDTEAYRKLLGRFFSSESLYEQRDADGTAAFLFYVLKPLLSEEWTKSEFAGNVLKDNAAAEPGNMQGIRYNMTLTIRNETDLTVGEYMSAGYGMIDGFYKIMAGKSEEELADKKYMSGEVDRAIEELKKKWSVYKLWIDVDACYFSFAWDNDGKSQEAVEEWKKRQMRMGGAPEDAEDITEPLSGTREDYVSLLSLMKLDYKQMSVAEFDKVLSDWRNENYNSYSRIIRDAYRDDPGLDFSEEERDFLRITVGLTLCEETMDAEQFGTETSGVGGSIARCLGRKCDGQNVRFSWDEMSYCFSYYIHDISHVTVGERDRCVGGMIDEAQEFWDEMDMEAALNMNNRDITEKLNEIAKKYYSRDISFWQIYSFFNLGWRDNMKYYYK